ncbi:hypothetical protein D3C71_157470 [compost metagenome]
MFLILAGSFLAAIRGAPYTALLSLLVTLLGGAMFLTASLQANRHLKSRAAAEALQGIFFARSAARSDP